MKIPCLSLRLFKVRTSNKGFAMAEAMIAIAILGVVSTVIVSQLKLSSKATNTEASDVEVNNVTRKVISEISDQATCTKNFLNAGHVNTAVSQLVNSSGTMIMQEGDHFGVTTESATNVKTSQGEVILTGIDTKEADVANNNEMVLRLTFSKKSGGIFNRSIIRDIPLITVLDASNKITSCFGDYDLLAKNAVELSCGDQTTSNSSLYVQPTASSPYGTCVHNNIITNVCDDGTLPKKYIKSVATNSNHEITYTCSTLENLCTGGQMITAFKSDGTVTCGYAFTGTSTCGVNQVLVKNSSGANVCTTIDCTGVSPISAFGGFNTNGTAICNPITTAKNCGTDNFATQINTDGSISCGAMAVSGGGCGINSRIQGINSSGGINCVPFINIPVNCPAGQAITGVDGNGNVTCQPIRRPLNCAGSVSGRTYQDCAAWGGSVWGHFSNTSMCIFNGASCPGGWARCQSYGTQTTGACADTSNTYYCDANRSTRYAVPYGGNGAYQNAGQNAVTCYQWTGFPNTGHACYAYAVSTAYTNQTQVGCY